MRVQSFICFCLLFLLGAPTFAEPATPSAPMALVQTTIDQVRDTVEKHKAQVSDEQLEKLLKEVIDPVFNFNEMAKRCLGKNWNEATPAEREEYLQLFSELLSATYLSRVKEIENTEVVFLSDKVKGERALIRTEVKSDTETFPIDYRMQSRDGSWKVYDVVIENISLVSNYRSEFAGIVRKEKVSGLVERLREKIAKKRDSQGTPS